MCVKCNKIYLNNFRNFRNCQCKQGVTNIIFTVFQSGWTVLEEKNSQNQSRKCRSKSSMTVWNPFTPRRESKMALTTRRILQPATITGIAGENVFHPERFSLLERKSAAWERQHSQVQQSSASLQPGSGVLVQHNEFQHLQSSANSTAFIARGGQIFPRPQYNFSNCNVQIHNHYGQSGWKIDSWHCDNFCPLKVIRFFEETDINKFFERTILSARCQFIQ